MAEVSFSYAPLASTTVYQLFWFFCMQIALSDLNQQIFEIDSHQILPLSWTIEFKQHYAPGSAFAIISVILSACMCQNVNFYVSDKLSSFSISKDKSLREI